MEDEKSFTLESFLGAAPVNIYATNGAQVTVEHVTVKIVTREEDSLRKFAEMIGTASAG